MGRARNTSTNRLSWQQAGRGNLGGVNKIAGSVGPWRIGKARCFHAPLQQHCWLNSLLAGEATKPERSVEMVVTVVLVHESSTLLVELAPSCKAGNDNRGCDAVCAVSIVQRC